MVPFSVLDLSNIAQGGTAGEPGNLSFRRETVPLGADQHLTLTLPAHGGFVLTLD